MPGPLEEAAFGSGELPGPCGRAWCFAKPCLRYHLTASIAIKTTTASPAAPPTTPPAIVPAGGVLLLLEFEFEAGSVLVGAAFEVKVYWLAMLLSPSVVALDVVVGCPELDKESVDEAEPDDAMESVMLDAWLMEVDVVPAAETVRVLPSKTVVYASADRDSVVTSP